MYYLPSALVLRASVCFVSSYDGILAVCSTIFHVLRLWRYRLWLPLDGYLGRRSFKCYAKARLLNLASSNCSAESKKWLRIFDSSGVAQAMQETSEGDDPSDLGEVGRWGGKG